MAKKSNKASCQTAVMGGCIKKLDWVDDPKNKVTDVYKVMSRAEVKMPHNFAEVKMPHNFGNACIEITEQTYPDHYYQATLWCFDCGTKIAEGRSVIETKEKAFEWWTNFVCGFLTSKTQIIYEFVYTDCVYESAMTTISVHRTKRGAYKAMRKFITDRYMDWYDERIIYGKPKIYLDGADRFDPFGMWEIRPIELKE